MDAGVQGAGAGAGAAASLMLRCVWGPNPRVGPQVAPSGPKSNQWRGRPCGAGMHSPPLPPKGWDAIQAPVSPASLTGTGSPVVGWVDYSVDLAVNRLIFSSTNTTLDQGNMIKTPNSWMANKNNGN